MMVQPCSNCVSAEMVTQCDTDSPLIDRRSATPSESHCLECKLAVMTSSDCTAVSSRCRRIRLEVHVVFLLLVLQLPAFTHSISTSTDSISDVSESDSTTYLDLPVYDVQSYGAVGDGRTDDTDAILKAASGLNETGGTLYFPTGRYVLQQAISIIVCMPNSTASTIIRVRGDGVDKSTVLWSSSYGWADSGLSIGPWYQCPQMQAFVSDLVWQWNATNGVPFGGIIYIEGNQGGGMAEIQRIEINMVGFPNDTSWQENSAALSLDGLTNASITDVTLSGLYQSGVYLQVQNTQIQTLTVRGSPNGVNFSQYAICTYGGLNGGTIDVLGSDVQGSGLLFVFACQEDDPQDYCMVVTITNTRVTNGWMQAAIDMDDWSSLVVTNSSFTGSWNSTWAQMAGRGCAWNNDCQPNMTFIECTFENFTMAPLLPQCGYLTLLNTIVNNVPYVVGSAISDCAGDLNLLLMDGNEFDNLTAVFDQFGGVADAVNFTNNVCTNVAQKSAISCFSPAECFIINDTNCGVWNDSSTFW